MRVLGVWMCVRGVVLISLGVKSGEKLDNGGRIILPLVNKNGGIVSENAGK